MSEVFLILEVTPQICETAKYEPAKGEVWMYAEKSAETNIPETIMISTQHLTGNVAIMPVAAISLPKVRLFSAEMLHTHVTYN